MKLEGKKAIVTGAASGIGYGIATHLAQAGADVAILDLDGTKAKQAADEIAKITSRMTTWAAIDVSNEEDVIKTVNKCLAELGQIDILVNNAGIQIISPIIDFKLSDWEKVIDVNLTGMFLMTKYCMRHMKEQGGGHIIYIGSAHSFEASLNKSAYVASKHATHGLMHAVAKEGAQYNITANLVAPGFVLTPLVKQQIPEQATQLGISEEEVISKILLKDTVDGQFTTVEDVAKAVCFFAASQTRAMTGQSLVVSHGWHMV